MASPNIAEIVATTIESRSGEIADNVTRNSALLSYLKDKKNVRTVSGGSSIIEELSYATNSNGGWYSGYDQLPVAAQDVITAASFSFKQYAIPVVISGLEKLQNSGKEAKIDLIESRIRVAEATLANDMSTGVYGDGTASGGKALTGLGAAVVASPSTGTYGGIDRSLWTFWRNQTAAMGTAPTSTNVQGAFNSIWVKLIRGKDRPGLIVVDNNFWTAYEASLQALQRFTSQDQGKLGFDTLKYKSADVVLDGGLGGAAPANVAYFLNLDYLFFRPHKDRNMVALNPEKRAPVNQDAEVQILGWAGNMTASNCSLQGYLQGS
jgi:hypothetical protein